MGRFRSKSFFFQFDVLHANWYPGHLHNYFVCPSLCRDRNSQYRIHSNSSALRLSKTRSWWIMMGSEYDLKSMHFWYKNHRFHLFLCAKSLMMKGGERLLGHERLFEWIRYMNEVAGYACLGDYGMLFITHCIQYHLGLILGSQAFMKSELVTGSFYHAKNAWYMNTGPVAANELVDISHCYLRSKCSQGYLSLEC